MWFFIVPWILFGFWSARTGFNRGESWWKWFAAGAIFGPSGVLFAYRVGATCASCKGKVNPKAKVCKHCGSELVLDPKPSIFSVGSMIIFCLTLGAAVAFVVWLYGLAVSPRPT